MRIGIDIDGVLADTDTTWRRHFLSHAEERGYEVPSRLADCWDFWKDINRKSWDECLHDRKIVLSHGLHDGAEDALLNLCLHNELYCVTSRPKDAQQDTIAWLERVKLYDCFEEVIFSDDKLDVAQMLDLDFHVDDAPKHIEALTGSQTIPIIFHTNYNSDLMGLRYASWPAIERFLSAARVYRAAIHGGGQTAAA
jgi:5'(3')-deoxyribonucleotidase